MAGGGTRTACGRSAFTCCASPARAGGPLAARLGGRRATSPPPSPDMWLRWRCIHGASCDGQRRLHRGQLPDRSFRPSLVLPSVFPPCCSRPPCPCPPPLGQIVPVWNEGAGGAAPGGRPSKPQPRCLPGTGEFRGACRGSGLSGQQRRCAGVHGLRRSEDDAPCTAGCRPVGTVSLGAYASELGAVLHRNRTECKRQCRAAESWASRRRSSVS